MTRRPNTATWNVCIAAAAKSSAAAAAAGDVFVAAGAPVARPDPVVVGFHGILVRGVARDVSVGIGELTGAVIVVGGTGAAVQFVAVGVACNAESA